MEELKEQLAAGEKYEHLAGTVRVAINELCWLAEQNPAIADPIYAITQFVEDELRA